MFDGEAASLEAIMKTQTVKVPRPIKVCRITTEPLKGHSNNYVIFFKIDFVRTK